MANSPNSTYSLKYKVYKWSSYSAHYSPQNILVNKPSKQSSRWSSETNFLPQFIMLKLLQPAIVQSITFGKYDKDHVCNLKKFKVYGGLEENNLIEILQDGLKNDNIPETFAVKCKLEKDQFFPSRYIKIAPILSWGPSYNFSIWYVELRGVCNQEIILPCIQQYYKYKELEAIRLCLKHFREHDYMDAFKILKNSTNVVLESCLVSKLHHELVEDGNFEKSEDIVEQAANENLFSEYINDLDYRAVWNLLESEDGIKPGMRGGHQMVINYFNNIIYVFGGWSGRKDLADFWAYNCIDNSWCCLSENTSECGGPSPRSCHKMCMDSRNGLIYVLGRYLDSSKRNQISLNNELYVFSTITNSWKLLCPNVSMKGGPKLIFDHQMCYDGETDTIYVFGGRVLTSSAANVLSDAERSITEFSGLYSYKVATDTWSLLREDSGNAGPQDIRSRIGHSMLLDAKQRRLYIFGGQRLKEDVNDFLYYDIEKDHVVVLSDGASKDSSIPPPGFTQRATIDDEFGEIYMLSGLSKDRGRREENMHNSFWVYNIKNDNWRCVYKNDHSKTHDSSSKSLLATTTIYDRVNKSTRIYGDKKSMNHQHMDCKQTQNDPQPCPRYAHQLVYDPIKKIHYMFGGNPGKTSEQEKRLDDFWKLKLTRPDKNDILKKCRHLIRRQNYAEMAKTDPLQALNYLSTRVYETVEHNCEKEARRYRFLASRLFGDSHNLLNSSDSEDSDDSMQHFVAKSIASSSDLPSTSSSKQTSENINRINRTVVFNKLMEFFNQDSSQPQQNITDLLPL